jgi:RNA polymerase sigma-70 factor (ECF subfamily)
MSVRAGGSQSPLLEQEFDRLVRLHRTRLIKIAFRYCRSSDLAEDAVQAGLLKAWVGLPTFRRDAKLSTWLTAIVINEVLQILRKQKRRTMIGLTAVAENYVFDPDTKHSLAPSPEVRLLWQERDAHIRAALQKLPEHLRKILILNLVHEIPIKEVADMLGISKASAKTRVYRGRQELRRRCEKMIVAGRRACITL